MTHELKAWPARYELLDGLRGAACLGVLLHHLRVASFGHYAVMIFFVISGYCITASARSCQKTSVTFSEFMLRRARRIYPPYLLALLFFVATRLAKSALTGAGSWHPSFLDLLQNLTLTQWLSIPLHPIAWPSDNPKLFVAAFWSLNYEEQFYLVTGFCLLAGQYFKISLHRTFLSLFAIGLTWNLIWPGDWIVGVFIEYWAHFALGAAVYFLLCEYPSILLRRVFFGATALLIAYCLSRLYLDTDISERTHRIYYELPLLAAFATFLILARPLSLSINRSLVWKPVAALGAISYSLYLVHQFNLTLVDSIVARLSLSNLSGVTNLGAKIMLHIGIATMFWFACERPFLKRRVAKISAGQVSERVVTESLG